jgi:hypothetical protein
MKSLFNNFALTFARMVSSKWLRSTNQSLKKKTTLVSMVRNEKGLIETFCAHVMALFDRVIIVDHLSTDGTREYLTRISNSYPNLECYFLMILGGGSLT